jgi:hypothetical protein
MKINRNHCYYCGVQVDPNNYEDIGPTTIWVCDDRQCQKELQDEIREFTANEAAQAKDERENGWKYY